MKTMMWILSGAVLLCTAAALSYAQPAAVPDSVQSVNDKYLADLKTVIKGKEDQPASEVYLNIQMMKKLPAARLLDVMNNVFARSLGVTCAHCHIPREWQKEDKPQKQIARDMVKMVGAINDSLLASIKNLKDPNPRIGCFTCHRGQVIPAGAGGRREGPGRPKQ